jgi:hypothetical protein
LRYFYDRNASATSERGKRGTHVKISDAKRELKARYGLTQQQVAGNLTYLLDKGWIRKTENERTYTTKYGTSIPSHEGWYVISSTGIDKLEGESEFRENGQFSGINIGAINASGETVITVGAGNFVNVKFEGLRKSLDGFRSAVVTSDDLTEDDKLAVAADIETINGQIVKPNPDPTIVRRAWSAIEKLATGAQLVQFVAAIAPEIARLGL